MLDKITGEEHSRLNILRLDVRNNLLSVNTLAAGRDKSEPARIRIRLSNRKDKLLLSTTGSKLFIKIFKILSSLFSKFRELLKLCYAYGSLHIRRFKVISEMRINVFMIISLRQISILAVISVTAEVIAARRTYTVTSPVTHRPDDLMKKRIIGIYRSSLAHGHMVRRIERRCSDITDGTGLLGHAVNCIKRSERITVILNQPQIMLIAELLNCLKIKRISQSMSHHNGLGLLGISLLKKLSFNTVARNIHIQKYRHAAILNDRIYRRRKARSNSDHFITRTYSPFTEQW